MPNTFLVPRAATNTMCAHVGLGSCLSDMVKPIQKVIETKIEEIEKMVTDISKQISDGETYRISIEKRNSDLSSQEIISKIASKIKNKVSLEFPDKVILIEILGDKTGISILKKVDVLSVEKTKRSISE